LSSGIGKNATHSQPLIPGAYERNTLTYRQLGAMGGPAFGSADDPIGHSSLSAATIADRQKEGGGAVSQRCHPDVTPDRTHEAPIDREADDLLVAPEPSL